MAASKLMMVVVVIAIASFRLPSAVAKNHIVGDDPFGWIVPKDGVNYTLWASQRTFNVGDTLLFNFTTGFDDVTEVPQSGYGPCNNASAMYTKTDGPATITLNTTGNHYYICTIEDHCQHGQKLAINVGTGCPRAPNGSTTRTPSPAPSSASSFTAVVTITFLVAALAMFH